ncbi:hypothetical protein Y1Q_0023786 [Alligator mississippiensis]|uniref:Uncharacterized protein n=1 Tax=Alligator mississippiensis TaxID=8496 RepID=A0A151MKC1_ALLMI|nr:hypothetical protein Y1Q_0023786 [Alligator mississippiensis]
MKEKVLLRVLNCKFKEDATSEKEVKTKIGIAVGHLAKLKKIWTSRNITLKTKLHLVYAVVILTILYGCKT